MKKEVDLKAKEGKEWKEKCKKLEHRSSLQDWLEEQFRDEDKKEMSKQIQRPFYRQR